MWPKPKGKKGKSRKTQAKLKAVKSEKDENKKTGPPEDEKASKSSEQSENHPVTLGDGDEVSGVWKARVLNAYKENPRDSHSLLATIPSGRARLEAGERQISELVKESMVKIVDRMFDNFQNTAYKFNQVTAGSDLELTWIRPTFSSEATGQWVGSAESQIEIFGGRISTRYWTLVVRGAISRIETFILPSDKLLSFGTNHSDYAPYLELVPDCDGLSVFWKIGEREVPVDLFPSVFRALLDGLIRYANEEATPGELFRLEDIGFVSEAREPEPIPDHLRSDKPELLSLTGSEPEGESDQDEDEDEDEADEGEKEKSQEGSGDVFDPGSGFIADVSSKVAFESTQEVDKLRESFVTQERPQPAMTRDEADWKMVGGQLPPAVAQEWQSYIQNTRDTAEAAGISGPAAGVNQDTGEWHQLASGPENVSLDGVSGLPPHLQAMHDAMQQELKQDRHQGQQDLEQRQVVPPFQAPQGPMPAPGQQPPGQFAQQYQSGPHPAQAPYQQYPAQYQSGPHPAQFQQMPPQQMPPHMQMPPQQMPPQQMPPQQMPPHMQMPPQQMPPQQMPPQQVPPHMQMPPQQMPPQQMPPPFGMPPGQMPPMQWMHPSQSHYPYTQGAPAEHGQFLLREEDQVDHQQMPMPGPMDETPAEHSRYLLNDDDFEDDRRRAGLKPPSAADYLDEALAESQDEEDSEERFENQEDREDQEDLDRYQEPYEDSDQDEEPEEESYSDLSDEEEPPYPEAEDDSEPYGEDSSDLMPENSYFNLPPHQDQSQLNQPQLNQPQSGQSQPPRGTGHRLPPLRPSRAERQDGVFDTLPAINVEADVDLTDALSVLLGAVDRQVEILSRQGAEAFSQKDFKRAEVIVKLSERLTEFKADAASLLDLLESNEE